MVMMIYRKCAKQLESVYNMELPIFHKLSQLINENAISLHVPGHKNGTIGNVKIWTLKWT